MLFFIDYGLQNFIIEYAYYFADTIDQPNSLHDILDSDIHFLFVCDT